MPGALFKFCHKFPHNLAISRSLPIEFPAPFAHWQTALRK